MDPRHLSPQACSSFLPANSHHSCWLGRLRSRSRRWHFLHGLLIAQLVLPPLPLPPVSSHTFASEPEDTSAPAEAPETPPVSVPAPLLDSDGDHLPDVEEAAAGTNAFNPDSDHDGLSDHDEVMVTTSNPLSPDSNADGISDYNAFYGCLTVNTLFLGPGASPDDWDGDGLKDPVDPNPLSALNIPDSDGDHVPDSQDSHPLDPGLWNDRNGNGLNDDAELPGADLDGDGTSDSTDSHPGDPALFNDWNFNGRNDQLEDWDEDGVSNLQDSHPGSNNLWCDWNGNGVNDDVEASMAAGTGQSGSAPEGAGDEDLDGDGYTGDRDSHPSDARLWNDHNGNGVNDESEAPADTDRDGIPDVLDAFPEDLDNDGLSDAQERALGTSPGESDSDGDGLSDADEVQLGTSPLELDTDGDGLTDGEELNAYHSDPLEPTRLGHSLQAYDDVAGESPTPQFSMSLSQRVSAADASGGTRVVEHVDGSTLTFPSKSATPAKAELTKTLVVTNIGTSTLAGLSASLSGPDATQFRLGAISSVELSKGSTRTLTLSFLAPAPTTKARSATLTFSASNSNEPLFTLQLRSIVSKGLWSANDDYFFADYTDSDQDGIPDLVEAMYLPLVVTADGDLDGDGVRNLEQYLAGRDLRDRAKSTDVDADGLTNVMEDAWNAAYPGRLNKYYFADAVSDPDGDGLLTLEELTCSWGGKGKDPLAVATHPFIASSALPSASKTATYKVTTRTPPKTSAIAAAGGILSRQSRHAAWMNDGQLRRALHETAAINGGVVSTRFFIPERIVHAASTTLQTIHGSDHLPLGYLGWLSELTPPLLVPDPLPDSFPENIRMRLSALELPKAKDPDDDGMPTAWEAANDLDWRDASDSDLPNARAALLSRTVAITTRRRAIGTELGELTGSTAAIKTKRAALTLEDDRLNAELEALGRVLGRLTPESSSWEGWSTLHYVPTVDGQPAERSSHLVPIYAIAQAKFPTALAATPATTWNSRRTTWIDKQVAALYWQVLAALDPDHDGLMNADEHLQNLNPQLPDYAETSGRDTDGDGFTDAMELTTGTDPLNAGKKPVYAIDILTPAAQRNITALQPMIQPLRLRTVLRGPGGSWPLAGQRLTASAPDTLTLLAWGNGGGSSSNQDWRLKNTLPPTMTDLQGVALLHVNPTWKKGPLNLTLKSTPGSDTPAGLKSASSTCTLTVTIPAGDSDADGLPDAWEVQAAQNEMPAHLLNKTSALDAEASPLHFGYHPATSINDLPESAWVLLNDLSNERAPQGYLPDYPITAASHSVIAIPTSENTARVARNRILALVDPDHDGWSNLEEYQNGTHPRYPDNPDTLNRDSDGDGVSNILELKMGSNPFSSASKPNPSLDFDGDGLSFREETALYHTDPLDPDTDGDGLNDGWESRYFDATINNLTDDEDDNDPDANPDWDGLDNQQEERLGTNPLNADTDGDGDDDFMEHQYGSNPLDKKITLSQPGGVASGNASAAPDYSTLFPPSVLKAPEVRLGVSCSITTGSGILIPGNYSVILSNKDNMYDTSYDNLLVNARGGRSFPEIGTFSYLSDFNKRGWPFLAGKTYRVQFSPSTTLGVQDRLLAGQREVYCTLEFTIHSGESNAILVDAPLTFAIPIRQFYGGALGLRSSMCPSTFDMVIPWVRTQALSSYPSDRARRKFGVGEEAWVAVKPEGLNAFLTDQFEDSSLRGGTAVRLLKLASQACSPSLGMTLGAYSQSFVFWDPETGGITPYFYPTLKNRPQIAKQRFSVVEPASESAIKLGDLTYPRTSQGVGMTLEVRVKPTDVSFYNVQMREVDLGTTWASGVFADIPRSRLAHHPSPIWVNLTQDNRWNDGAEFHGFPRQEWGFGKFDWKIGVEWSVAGSSPRMLPTFRIQEHEMADSSGSSRITKTFGTGTPLAASRILPLPEPVLSIDANRDGRIDFGEAGSQARPLRFWINNDSDWPNNDEEEENSVTDGSDTSIGNRRDLEDLLFVKFFIPEEFTRLAAEGRASIGLRWKPLPREPMPKVRVFRPHPSITKQEDYLWNLNRAELQTQGARYSRETLLVDGGRIQNLPRGFLHYTADGYAHSEPQCLLIEGVGKGMGQLCMVLSTPDGRTTEGPGVWLKFMDVLEMFENAQGVLPPGGNLAADQLTAQRAGGVYPNPPDHAQAQPPRPQPGCQRFTWPGRNAFEPAPDETQEAIVQVHGWNMTDADRRVFSATFFKRLWWKGYKGRYAAFAWPTYNVDDDSAGIIPAHFNKSEYVAWKYGPALRDYVNSLGKPSRHVAAHSMGNVVMASALKSGLSVSSYVAMEAAIPSGCYDGRAENNSFLKFLQAEQSKPSPDIANPDLGYRSLMSGVSGNFHNFHSANDFALATGTALNGMLSVSWEANQVDHKPNHLLDYLHDASETGAAKNRIERDFEQHILSRDITDHHEVMSFIARPRSRALGAQDTTGFTTNFNMKDTSLRYPFSTDRTEHSGQYQRPIQKTHKFFNVLLQRVNVGFNSLTDIQVGDASQ